MPAPVNFEALMAGSPNAYVVLDRNLVIVWMNEAYLAATMRAREELLGQSMFVAFPSDPGSESHMLLDGSFQRVLDSGQRDEIALIRYDIRDPDGNMATRYWSATHTPLTGAEGAVEYILQHTVDVTELQNLRALRDAMGVVQRASAVQARNRDLSEESEQLKALFEQAPGFVALLSGPDHTFRLANRAYLQLVGQRDVIGKGVAEALPEIVDQGFIAVLDTVRATREPYFGRGEKVVLENASLGRSYERYLDFIYQPIIADSGEVTGVLVQGHDVSEQIEAQEQQALLINELNHRVKNTLAIVQSLASQSFKGVSGSEDARRRFDARLGALAAAHSLLTAQNWKAARLWDTIRSAVEATAGSDIARIHCEGPDLQLRPQAAMSAAMMIHELSTNAIKYGALSVSQGRVDLRWSIAEQDDRHHLLLEWRETGGPPVTIPERRGFGTRLIETGISTGSGGKARLEFLPQGLLCTVDAILPKDQ